MNAHPFGMRPGTDLNNHGNLISVRLRAGRDQIIQT
jgi:hypothetical protein